MRLYDKLLQAVQSKDENTQNSLCDKIRSGLQTATIKCDPEVTHAVLTAAKDEDLTVLRFLLTRLGADCLSVRNPENDTIVHIAARLQGVLTGPAALELMVEHLGIDCLRLEGCKSRKALHCAAWNRNSPAALFWLLDRLEQRDFIDDADDENFTALQYVFAIQDTRTLQVLAERDNGRYLRVKGEANKTAFHMVAMNEDNSEALMWLIDTQENPDDFLMPDANGDTPVHLAFWKQDASAVKALVDKLGFDCLSLQGENGRTAVHYATLNERNHGPLLWLLENQQSDMFCNADGNGDTAIHLAFWKQCGKTINELVSSLGIDCLKQRGERGRTAAHYAALNERSSSALLWIIETQDQSILLTPDAQGDCAFHQAFWKQDAHVAIALIEKLGRGCLKLPGGKYKRTAAHYAALNERSASALLYLIENHESHLFHAVDAEETTPLHWAFRNQTAEVVARLVSKAGWGRLRSQIDNKQTAAHFAALNERSPSAFYWLLDTLEPEIFLTSIERTSTAMHYAFKVQTVDTVQRLVGILGTDCLALKGFKGRTAVHYAALNERSPSAILWLIDNLDMHAFTVPDNNGDTPVHFAFLKQNDKVAELLLEKLGLECLSLPGGKYRRTIAHYAADNERSPAALLWLVANHDPSLFLCRDTDEATALHIALLKQDVSTVAKLVNKVGNAALTLRGYRNRTCAHYAARNERSEGMLAYLFDNVKDSAAILEVLKSTDDDGRTCLHVCTLNRAHGVPMFERIYPLFGKSDKFDALKMVDKDGRNPLFIACLAKNFNFFHARYIDLDEHQCIDKDGNTLLHALFLVLDPRVRFSFSVGQLADVAEQLIKAGVDFTSENKAMRNCLLASELDENNLKSILKRISQPELKKAFSKLQRNSNGLHAIHVFCSRYSIMNLQTPLCQLCDLSLPQLLSIGVNEGPMKGATSLHFACEAGHKENISYLLSQGLKLEDYTTSNQTCVDYACQSGKLPTLCEVAVSSGVDLSEILRLVDPTRRALPLPDRQSARNLLNLFSDLSLRTNIERNHSSRRMVDTAGNQASPSEAPEVLILYRALELDSSQMLRSLIVAGFAAEDMRDQVINYILMRKEDESEAQQRRSFKDLEKFRMLSEDFVEHLTLIECAIFFEKPKLLSDLMLLPQFDIIPETLRLLIHLRPKVELMRNEQLKRVRDKALNVVVNVLENLCVNAHATERRLLFKYLTANFTDEKNVLGPKFPGPVPMIADDDAEETDSDDDELEAEGKAIRKHKRHSRQAKRLEERNKNENRNFMSVMDMVEMLDCDDLYATECISQLVDRQWRKPPPLPWDQGVQVQCNVLNKRSKVSIQQRFGIYMTFYLVFLAYFAWYVTDFKWNLEHPAADIILLAYALSLTLQEVDNILNKSAIMDVYIRHKRLRVPLYFTDLFNYFDISGFSLMWAGVVLKLLGRVVDASLYRSCQVVLSTSFLLLGFRFVALLSYFRVTGPKICILKSLIFKDLLPFVLIMFVLIYSFGVFFFNLLFPAFADARDEQSLTLIFTLPVSLMFGLFENTLFTSCNSSKEATGLGCADLGGNNAYNGILIFFYLLIVNLVMWNLLIALFTYTVSQMATKANGLWRKNQFELLQEFSEISPIPPPLSFPYYAWKLLRRCPCFREVPRLPTEEEAEKQQQSVWWQNQSKFANYPAAYRRFLTYQAEQLRQCRAQLRRSVEGHRGDADALKAHMENEIAENGEEVCRDLREHINSLETELKGQLTRLESDASFGVERLETEIYEQRQKLANLELQMKHLLLLLGGKPKEIPAVSKPDIVRVQPEAPRPVTHTHVQPEAQQQQREQDQRSSFPSPEVTLPAPETSVDSSYAQPTVLPKDQDALHVHFVEPAATSSVQDKQQNHVDSPAPPATSSLKQRSSIRVKPELSSPDQSDGLHAEHISLLKWEKTRAHYHDMSTASVGRQSSQRGSSSSGAATSRWRGQDDKAREESADSRCSIL
ncbi:hypothetical protein BOX15_Mlig023275g1 [Macrostomum lignano]|uniref:Uncharacterized protein n=2 Tax=Macrostomum lignano TaxID=282301 RepID=A0A267H051_9PLAT|nr:hypothetical protein BOX15_Mlig023275g1 [Macrostomum lignano]